MRIRIPFTRRRNRTAGQFILPIMLVLFWSPQALGDPDEPAPGIDRGWRIAEWSLHTSLYTHHFDPDPDHNNDQNLIGVETLFENNWLAGIGFFDNSFGQPSQFAYIGRSWPIRGSEHWSFKLRGGLLHGYKEPYEDKIPFNGLGIAPAIVPSLVFGYRWVFLEANLGGLAVVTLTGGVRF
jgi:hypothetical protein